MKPSARTIVNHSVRTELGLSCDEYVMAMTIHEHNDIHPSKILTFQDYYDLTGFKQQEVITLLPVLKEMDIIQKGVTGRPEMTSRWLAYFNVDLTAEFKLFWAIENKGSRVNAEIQYKKCRKVIDKDTLFDSYRAYLKWAEAVDRFKLDTCTWLNPKSKSWEEDYTIPKEKDNTKQPSIGKFF